MTAAVDAAAKPGARYWNVWWRRVLDDERSLGQVMLAPALIYIILLVGFPFFLALYYSISDVTVGSRDYEFVGLQNFARIVQNPTFWVALENTLIFTVVSQVVVVVFAKILAMILISDFRGKWFVRLLILLPWAAPISLGAIGWLWILDSTYSVVNWTLQALGIMGDNAWPIWLGEPNLAMASIITVHVWRVLPLATVIVLAGLSSISQDILDAAAIDGAGFWRRLFEITLPLVMPILLVAVLFGTILTFADLIVVYILTRGGPFDSTQVLASWAFFTGIQGGDLAEGAAIALFLFPVLVALAVVLLLMARRAEVA